MSPLAANTSKGSKGRTRRGWVAQQILRSIVSGEFQGGDRLIEEEVAATIGVSRTPVREAFSNLAGIGLIATTPNHGAIVRPFGPSQVREIYQIRSLLECEATRLAAEKIDLELLRELRERSQKPLTEPRTVKWSAHVLDLDNEFHDLISSQCGSARLAEEIGRYRTLVQAIRAFVGNNASAQELALADHTEVIDALLARNADQAAASMRVHIQHGTEAAIQAMFGKRAEANPGKEISVSISRAVKK